MAGAGIAGLSAAWALSAHPDVEVVVRDPAPPGGKLRTTPLAGRPVEEGPDAFLTRVPEAVALCEELGLGAELVAPAAGRSMLWWGGRLRPLPDGLVLGVPASVGAVARSGILSPLGALRAGLDLVAPRRPDTGDVTVRDLVAGRFGAQVADRLVDPLVGGIHAGRTDRLSAAATVPQLVAAARRSRSLLRGLRAPAGGAGGPVFLTPRGGLSELVGRLVDALADRGVVLERAAVGAVAPVAGAGVEVDGERADGAVLALPAPEACEVLRGSSPAAAAGLGGIEHASVALVTLAFAEGDLVPPPGVNGYLVPRPEGRLTTAVSFASSKWPHWAAPGQVLLRVSAGRHLDERAERLSDDALVARLVDELGEALDRPLPAPAAARVSRWPRSFPQYTVGHLDRVAAVEASLARDLPGVVLAGAALRGSGIPACIASGRRAAAGLLAGRAPFPAA